MPNTDTNQVADPHTSDRLSFWTKVAYAIGDVGNSVGPGTVIPFWYTFFLTDIVHALGLSANIPILLAAWTPAGVSMLVGLAMLFHLEDG